MMTNWHQPTNQPDTSLFQQYTMRSACHTDPILLVSAILDFWTQNFNATVISTLLSIFSEISQSDWKHVGKMLCAVLWNSCLQIWNHASLKVVPLFLDHPIYGPLSVSGRPIYWSFGYQLNLHAATLLLLIMLVEFPIQFLLISIPKIFLLTTKSILT